MKDVVMAFVALVLVIFTVISFLWIMPAIAVWIAVNFALWMLGFESISLSVILITYLIVLIIELVI